jgi:hypothetical protein
MALFIFTTQVVRKIRNVNQNAHIFNEFGSRFEALPKLKLNLNLKQDTKLGNFPPLAPTKKSWIQIHNNAF